MRELVGFRLMTIQRVTEDGEALQRLHSSDASFPVGGCKSIRSDEWMQRVLKAGEPLITPDRVGVKKVFIDHDAIFALGCGSVLNVPVTTPACTLGTFNLLHEQAWFTPKHVLVAQPFAALLALAWQHATQDDHHEAWTPLNPRQAICGHEHIADPHATRTRT